MKHPDDAVLQQWADGELDEIRDAGSDATSAEFASASAVAKHVAECARCAAVVASVRQMGAALRMGSESLEMPSGSLADAVMAAVESPDAGDRKAELHALPTPPSAPARIASPRAVSGRAWVWPALAAAAALMFFVMRPSGRQADYIVKVPIGEVPEMTATLGAEVVSIDVEGAKSYTVMEVPGSAPGATTAVVWIQDEPEDSEEPSP